MKFIDCVPSNSVFPNLEIFKSITVQCTLTIPNMRSIGSGRTSRVAGKQEITWEDVEPLPINKFSIDAKLPTGIVSEYGMLEWTSCKCV